MRVIIVLIGAVLTSGCYAYLPRTQAGLEPGIRVSASLSDSGMLTLERYVGPNVAAVEGRVLRASDSEFSLAVLNVRQVNGVEAGWRGEQLTVSRGLVTRLEERKFSIGRTLMFTGALTIGSIVMTRMFEGLGQGSTPIIAPGSGNPR